MTGEDVSDCWTSLTAVEHSSAKQTRQQMCRAQRSSQNLASTPLLLLARCHHWYLIATSTAAITACIGRSAAVAGVLVLALPGSAGGLAGWLIQTFFFSNDSVDGRLKDFVYTRHLFRRALHVKGAHLLGDCCSLCDSNGSQTLGF